MSPFHGSHYQSARRTVANGKHRKRMQMQAMPIPEMTSSGLNMLDRTLRELRAATLSHYTFSGRDAGGLWRCSWCRVSLRSFGRKNFNALSLQPFFLDRNRYNHNATMILMIQWKLQESILVFKDDKHCVMLRGCRESKKAANRPE